MKLLVLGGTVFLGRHLAAAALAAGHEVTLFHRGRSGPDLFPEAEHLLGDREGDLSALTELDGRRWDAMIDTSGYLPSVVRASNRLLAERVDHATFVSSISVYADQSVLGQTEDGQLAPLPEGAVEQVGPETYGPLKALCEREVRQAWPGAAAVVRPGLLVGPFDPSGRFTSWPLRLADGGDVLAPGLPERPVQLIDARDAAAFLLEGAVARRAGVFNLTGPPQGLTMEAMLAACHDLTAPEATITWVAEDFLLGQGVAPWTELPLWVPPESQGLLQVDITRARDAGLACRPVGDTARDTLAWARAEVAAGRPVSCLGLDRAREVELLDAWRQITAAATAERPAAAPPAPERPDTGSPAAAPPTSPDHDPE